MNEHIVALSTARAKSRSVRNKNTLKINGQMYLHNVCEALKADRIDEVYVSSDIPWLDKDAEKYGFYPIHRSEELCRMDTPHYDVILDGLRKIGGQEADRILYKCSVELSTRKEISKWKEPENSPVDILVILLGNSVGATAEELDEAIKILLDESEASSIQSVGKFNMFNPFRAYRRADYLTPVCAELAYLGEPPNQMNEKDTFGDFYFFNGSFWIVRRQAIINNDGPPPFPWLGKNILPYVQPSWIQEVDSEWQLKLLRAYRE